MQPTKYISIIQLLEQIVISKCTIVDYTPEFATFISNNNKTKVEFLFDVTSTQIYKIIISKNNTPSHRIVLYKEQIEKQDMLELDWLVSQLIEDDKTKKQNALDTAAQKAIDALQKEIDDAFLS